MSLHHIQKQIIADLVACESARYADLKPKSIEGSVFTYHLQMLLRDDLIEKTADGQYQLTSKGKLFGINSSVKDHDVLEQAHSILLIAARNGNKWLLRRRLVQPMFQKIGFMHGEPSADETIDQALSRILKTRTGLEATFDFRGSGYIKLAHKDELVAYSHFSLFEAINISGELTASDEHGENFWLDNPDFNAEDMIPSMADLSREVKKAEAFFLDARYEI